MTAAPRIAPHPIDHFPATLRIAGREIDLQRGVLRDARGSTVKIRAGLGRVAAPGAACEPRRHEGRAAGRRLARAGRHRRVGRAGVSDVRAALGDVARDAIKTNETAT